jgi:C4-type Zn-finger protein
VSCIVQESGLCATCCHLGRKQTNEPNRVLELKDLCKKCRQRLKTSYVGTVKEPRKYYASDKEEPAAVKPNRAAYDVASGNQDE